ncbi:MAG: hypothetical protein V4662_19990 [Verrucomicrobiota bacterium]
MAPTLRLLWALLIPVAIFGITSCGDAPSPPVARPADVYGIYRGSHYGIQEELDLRSDQTCTQTIRDEAGHIVDQIQSTYRVHGSSVVFIQWLDTWGCYCLKNSHRTDPHGRRIPEIESEFAAEFIFFPSEKVFRLVLYDDVDSYADVLKVQDP